MRCLTRPKDKFSKEETKAIIKNFKKKNDEFWKKNEQTATDQELYNNLKNDPVRYVDVMNYRHGDTTKQPRDYPRKINPPEVVKSNFGNVKIIDQPKPVKNKKIFHGKPIDVESISKDMDKLMANSITTNPIPAPDLRKRIDPDLSKGLGNLKDYIPEDF